jgi:flagellum-specific ATP synthase
VQVGAYEAGTNPELDEAIRLREQMVMFLRQDMHISEDYDVSLANLKQLMS